MMTQTSFLQFWNLKTRVDEQKTLWLVYQLLFWSSAVYAVWGGYVELAKTLGWTFHALLPVAALVVVVWVAVMMFTVLHGYLMLRRVWSRDVLWPLIVTLFSSLALVWLTYRNVRGGSDFLVYAVGPAFHQASPDLPLHLGMAGRLEYGEVGAYGYLFPYALEYFLAAVSTLFGVPIVELALVWQPILSLFLMPWVILALLRVLGATAFTAVSVLLAFFLMGVLDNGTMLTWGFNSLGRVYENKGILYALGIPALMMFLLIAVSEGGRRQNVLALAVLSTALCFVTPNAIYLVPFVSGAILISVYGLQQVGRVIKWPDSPANIEFSKGLWLFLATITAPVFLMLVMQWIDGISVYEFVDLAHFKRFDYHFHVVFGSYNLAVWTGVGLSLFALLVWGTPAGRALGLATLVMAGFALNEWLFDQLMALGRGEAAVFWRFSLVMPVVLIPVVAVAGMHQDAIRGKILSWVALSLVLGGFIYTSMGNDKYARNVFQFDQVQTLAQFTQGHLTAEEHLERGYKVVGESLLGFSPKASLRAAIIIGGPKVVAGKGPSLYWQQVQLNNADVVADVFKSSHYLYGLEDADQSAFARTVERFSPGLILQRNWDEVPPERQQFIQSLGYELIQQTEFWNLYALPRLALEK